MNRFEKVLAEMCKALGHPARVRIMRVLSEKSSCFSGDLAEELPLAASTVSEHLRILKKANMIKGSIDGPRRNYCVNEESFQQMKDFLGQLQEK